MKKLRIGGQAVIEGVMMKSPNYTTIAVRKKNKIILKKEKIKKRPRFFKWIFFRGIVNLIDILVLGIKGLMWSADQQAEKKEDKITNLEMIITLLISFGFVVVIFIVVPYLLTYLAGFKEETGAIMFNLIDSFIKIGFFILYLLIISRMKDVKRLFQYHGAEHMAVHCYEHNKKLTVNNTKKFDTKHTRCGTSFLVIVLIVSILIFSFLPLLVIKIYPNFLNLNFWSRRIILIILRILVIPKIAGISYEFLRLSSRFEKNFLVKILMLPGLLVQKLTTTKPGSKQIEVAIRALKEVLISERKIYK